MTQFTLSFLGPFQVQVDGTPVTNFHSDKARALLAYLAIEPQIHARTELATLLWPGIDDGYARTNLRTTLYRLRQTLAQAAPGVGERLLTVTRNTIQFVGEPSGVDVLHFQELISQRATGAAPPIEPLAAAAALYRGELLFGLQVTDAAPFEEWLLLRRELLHQQAVLTLHALCTAYEMAGNDAQAYAVAGQLLTLDLYREESYRQSMRLLARMGQPHQALQQFEQLRRLLRQEMDIAPSPETVTLAQQIAAGDFVQRTVQRAPLPSPRAERTPQPARPSAAAHPVAVAPVGLYDVPDPGPFFGRIHEQQQLTQWLLHDRCRVVAILGIGGMGKTSLAAHTIRELAANAGEGQFAVVLWRSLLNAPPLTELLPSLLQTLSDHQLVELPASLDEQLRLLLRYLRTKRVLLVLDNLESILEPAQAGAYRPGYEPYGQLIQQMATLAHQSHLLLTSRERPRGYARLERDGDWVHALQLSGLDSEAGYSLLAQRGIAAQGDAESQLIKRYSGNPLALKLVADTVDEIFGGNIAEFLAEETLIFDDIRAVLDQHFARLTDLEQQILFWLTVEREPTAPQSLRKNLLRTPTSRDFMETLRDLQRRGLIEGSGADIALQNVVTEYLTERLIEFVVAEIKTGVLRCLRRQALLIARAKEYIRESQARLILKPIGEQLIKTLGRHDAQLAIQQVLEELRAGESSAVGYAAGNLLNLLLYHDFDLTTTNFSALSIRQAYLQGASLAQVNFADAEFLESLFTNNFGRVAAVAISPDSDLLAVGANDGNIRLWRLTDGQFANILTGHQSTVVSVAFSPDGHHLVSSSESHGPIYLWDVASGERIFILSGHQEGVGVVTFGPDGTMIASGGHDGTIRLWDANSGELLAILENHTDWVRALAFHPSGAMLVSSGLDRPGCYLWQRTDSPDSERPNRRYNYRLLGVLEGDKTLVYSAAFSPNGHILAIGGAEGVVLWDVAKRKTIGTLSDQPKKTNFIAFSPDSAILAAGTSITNINLWDIGSQRLINVLHRHEREVWDIAISGDGKTLASGGSDGLVHLWNIRDPQRVQVIRTLHGSVRPIYTLRVNPHGDRFATGEDEGRVRLWQVNSVSGEMQPMALLSGHTALVDALAFTPDGRRLASGAHDGTVRLWDVTSGECITKFATVPNCACHNIFSPDGTMFAYASFDTIHLAIIDSNGKLHPNHSLQGHSRTIRALSFSPDGKYLASCSIDNTARLWDVTTGVCLHVFDQDVINFWSLVFGPNGELLAGGGRTGIHIWDLRTEPYERIHYESMTAVTNIRPIVFSADGQYLVSGGIDRMVRIWNLENDVQLHSLAGHTADVTAVAFLPAAGSQEDTMLISGSYDGTVRLWDIRTGDCRRMVRIPGPYEGMNITGVTGISAAQRASLKALGAVETALSPRQHP